MRTRIALATAIAAILIPIILDSGRPSAPVAASRHHEAVSRYRPSHAVHNQLNTSWLRDVSNTQSPNNQQEAAWLTAVHNNQLAAFYQAVNNQEEAAWLTAVHNNQLAAFSQANVANQQEASAGAAPATAAPAAPAPAPPPVSPPSPSGGGWTGPWACIAQYESGGNPAADTGNGYYGGLQISMQTWVANGGVGNPADASISEQEAVAEQILGAQGWGAWPNTSRICGL